MKGTLEQPATQTLSVGDAVVFVDARGQHRAALVTAIHGNPTWGGPTPGPSINLVTVDGREDAIDGWGRQTIRESSVVHERNQTALGYYWFL